MAIATTARTTAEAFRAEYRQHIAQLEGDKRLSRETRERYVAASYRIAQRHLAELRTAHQVEVDSKLLELQHRVFARPDGADEEAHRRAVESASALTGEQLSKRLLRAERVGDEVTAHACYIAAVERGTKDSAQVVDRYKAARPDAKKHLDAMTTFESELDDRNDLLVTPLRPPQKPATLRQMNDYQISRLAAAVEPEPAPGPPVRIGIPT
jgi:hypothetical protein